LGPTISHAETNLYLDLESAGAGFDEGVGVSVGHVEKINDFFAFTVSGSAALQKKHGADDGYTYGAAGGMRGYVYPKFYLELDYRWTGYRSGFADGRVWQKSGGQPEIRAGYDGDRLDLGVSYSFKEHDTPNEVSAIGLDIAWKPWDSGMKLRCAFTRMRFDHAGERMAETIGSLGFGWEF
jgi:hypothetical protein